MNNNEPKWHPLTKDKSSYPNPGQDCVVTVLGEQKSFDYETYEQNGETFTVVDYLNAHFSKAGSFEIYFDCEDELDQVFIGTDLSAWDGVFNPYENYVLLQGIFKPDIYGFKKVRVIEQAEITITAWYAVPNFTYKEPKNHGMCVTPSLKKCPFCGGKAEITFSGKREPQFKGYIVAKCKSCGATSHGTYYEGEELLYPDQTNAAFEEADKWNRRVQKK